MGLRAIIHLLIGALALGIGGPASSYGATVTSQCDAIPIGEDGTHRQSFASVDDAGEIAALPPRSTIDVEPGDSTSSCVGFQNRTGATIDFDLEAADVGVDKDGVPASGVESLDIGASSWLQLPTPAIRDLAHGDIAWLSVQVAVPDDALAGSSYASVIATPIDRRPITGTEVRPSSSVATQLFFNVPGSSGRSGKVERISSPRIVWWDGLDLGRFPVFENFRGLGIAPIKFEWRNTGDYTSKIGGKVTITSDLGGRQVASLPVDEQLVLRSASRTYRVAWTNDVPLLGRFTPTIVLEDVNGKTIKVELPAIWVIPSWWYLLALFLALAVPITIRRRSRRRYRALEARVAAAEARDHAADHDEDDDDW